MSQHVTFNSAQHNSYGGSDTLNPNQVGGGVAVSSTNVYTGRPVSLKSMTAASFQAVWTGTPNGAWSFEVCNDPEVIDSTGALKATATFTALTLPSTFAAGNPAGSASSFVFEFTGMGEAWIRAKYTNASSTGTVSGVWNCKDL